MGGRRKSYYKTPGGFFRETSQLIEEPLSPLGHALLPPSPCLRVLAYVHLQVKKIAGRALRHHPHLEATLGGLEWQVLLHSRPSRM